MMARADRAVAEDKVFLPFAYVEAAANTLTNPHWTRLAKSQNSSSRPAVWNRPQCWQQSRS